MLSRSRLSRPWLRLLAFIALTLGPSLALSAGKPVITTSIHPLALLVAEVASDEVEIHTLIDAGQSPHTFQMRPSDRQRLADSDLIFWVGPSMELFLQNLMTQQDLREKSIALAPTILPEHFGTEPAGHQDHRDEHPAEHDDHSGDHGTHGSPEEKHIDESEHHQAHGDRSHDEHNHAGEDPHIWLEPGLAEELAKAIATALIGTSRVDETIISRNLEDFLTRLREADHAIRMRLDNRGDMTLFTYHEAFELFAEHYGIEIAGSLTFSPEIQPGARHLSEVRDQLRQAESPCILSEPQFSRQWWQSITAGVDPTISQWDPLGSGIETRTGGYIEFLNTLAQSVLDCAKR